jgi:hypothetical protein
MICTDIAKEKLTFRETDRNCRELINIESPQKKHYETVKKEVDFYFHSYPVTGNDIVPKEVVRRIENA